MHKAEDAEASVLLHHYAATELPIKIKGWAHHRQTIGYLHYSREDMEIDLVIPKCLQLLVWISCLYLFLTYLGSNQGQSHSEVTRRRQVDWSRLSNNLVTTLKQFANPERWPHVKLWRVSFPNNPRCWPLLLISKIQGSGPSCHRWT